MDIRFWDHRGEARILIRGGRVHDHDGEVHQLRLLTSGPRGTIERVESNVVVEDAKGSDALSNLN